MDTPDSTTDTTQPAAPPAPGTDSGTQGWMAAGAPGAGAPPPSPSPAEATLDAAANPDRSSVDTQSPDAGAAGSVKMQPVPVMLKPARPGLLGIVDKVADALTGSSRPDIYTDDHGNKYLYHPNLTHGQQWERIGAMLLSGAANGYAAGRGGNTGAAAAAGLKTGLQARQGEQDAERQMGADIQQADMNRANSQLMRMKLAEQSFKLSRLQPEADQATATTAVEHGKFLQQQHGQMIGTMGHANDLGNILKVQPDIADQMVRKGNVNLVPHYEQDPETGGWTRKGIEVWMMPDQWRKEILPPGSSFSVFDPQSHQIVQHQASDPMTAGDKSDYDTLAQTKLNEWSNLQLDQQAKHSDINKNTASADKDKALTPVEVQEKKANTIKAGAEANEANARAANLRALGSAANPDGTPNPRFEALANALYEGDITLPELKRETKGSGLDPNGIAARAVEIGQQPGAKYGPWSETLIDSELKFANSPKTTSAIDGIDRLLGTNGIGPLDQVIQTAKQAHLGTHGILNSASLATRRFFGDTAAKNMETAVSEARRSVAGLIGNPLLGGGETDKKLEQAEGLLGQSPTIENLTGANTLIKAALETQRASLISHNRILQRKYGRDQQQPQQAQQAQPKNPAAPAAPPAGAAGIMKFTDGKMHYIDAHQTDLGVAQ